MREMEEFDNEAFFKNVKEQIEGLEDKLNEIDPEKTKELLEALDRKIRESQDKKITLAQYTISKHGVNHSFPMKILDDGMEAIAEGADSFPLRPRRGKSNEEWELTGSKKAFSQYLLAGGNADLLDVITSAVNDLVSDPKGEPFILNGRIWFSTNAIVQEIRRTKGGTTRAREGRSDTEIVDFGLVAASSAQIRGVSPSGKPTDIFYLFDAERRENYEYNGEVYKNVWGFLVNANTLDKYAKEIGHHHSYPLLDREKPMSLDEAEIQNYLLDLLHQARNDLYITDKNNRAKRRRNVSNTTISRRWDELFQRFYPMYDINHLESRKKKKVVDMFNKVLTELADMESHNELHKGRPLYITAWSDRDPGRGKGYGRWITLNIECSNCFHTPIVDLTKPLSR